jgi:hypothetical protein
MTLDSEATSDLRYVSGMINGIPWQARSAIVGALSTDSAPGGNPIYNPTMPFYSGVASLLITKPAGTFLCSGSLLDDRRSILTAAHCITNTLGSVNALSATAYFYDGSSSPPYDPDTIVPGSFLSTAVPISNYFKVPGYSGAVIENRDLAVVRLASNAPGFARSYDLFPNNLTSLSANIAGYGRRSNVGGNVGSNLDAGVLRQGFNRYEYAWGDPNFNGNFNANFPLGLNTWVSDFDNGLDANDAGCLKAKSANPLLAGNPAYCDTGLGTIEADIAPGDSGGPAFIGDQIATVNSYILTFGQAFGDIDANLNSSFGEFGGYVPVAPYLDFIDSVKVPGPAPILGAAGLPLWSRQLRRRIRAAKTP